MEKSIKFNYLYRDAGNYKIYGEEIFSNPDAIAIQEIESRIRAALIDGQFFEPEEWGVKRLRFEDWDDDLDHDWNEFESVEETDQAGAATKTVSDFLKRISTTTFS